MKARLIKIASYLAAIVLMIAPPCVVIIQRFPVWVTKTKHPSRTIGAGAVLILFLLVFVFRKAVMEWIKAAIHRHPWLADFAVVAFWAAFIALCVMTHNLVNDYAGLVNQFLQDVNQFLQDLLVVGIAGAIGAGLAFLEQMVVGIVFGRGER